MKIRILAAIVFLFFTLPLFAQHTTVTAQVLDPTGVLYRTCSGSANFVGQNTTPGAGPYLLGGSVFQTVVPITCDSFARFTISLADNSLITPTPSQWRFAICSALGAYPGPPICFDALITISGASLDVTVPLQAVSAPLPPYSVKLETNGVVNGSQALLNLIAGTNITIVQDGLGNVTISSTGGGGGGGGGSPPAGAAGDLQYNNSGVFGNVSSVPAGSYLASNGAGAPPIYRTFPQIDIENFGAKGDGQVATDCYMSTSSTTLNCASSHFAVTDVGKVIAVYENGATTSGFVQPLSTTITNFVSGTQVTLNNAASNPTTSTVSTISSASRSNNVVTVTTSANHNLSAGQMVCMSSPPGASLDRTLLGCFQVQTVPSGTQFTINQWQQLDNASITVTSGVATGYSSRVVWGTNNDTAITNAANTCGDLGGCQLYIKAGHYLTHGVNLPCSKIGNWTAVSLGVCSHVHNNISVQGDGPDISTLENWDVNTTLGSNPASNASIIYIGAQADQYPYFSFASGGPLQPITGIHISGLTLIQVKYPTNNLKVFRSDNSDGTVIDHVKAIGWSREGFYLSGINYDAHDLIAQQVGLGGPGQTTATSALNLIAGWGRVHDSYVTDSGQCIEAGNPHQWVYDIRCDGGGNDIFSGVSPHVAVNVTSNTFGTWDVHVNNNIFAGWAGSTFENVNGIMRDVSYDGNYIVDDIGGLTLGTGKETNNVSVYPQQNPGPHGSSTCSNNTWVVTPNGRPGTYFISVAGDIQPVLENWTCDSNRVVYTTAFCSTGTHQPALDNSVCTGGGVATIPNGIFNVSSFSAPVWQATHSYAAGAIMQPTATSTSLYIYSTTAGGTSGGSEPSECTTTGCTFTDGTVTWALYGFRPQVRLSRTTIQAPTNAASFGSTVGQEINVTSTVPLDHQINITDWQYNLQTRRIALGAGINIAPNTGYTDTGRTQIENAAPAATANVDVLWADSTDHRWKMNNNNGGATDVLGASDWAVPGTIGSTTPNTGSFTTLNSTGGALNGTVGATTPSTGSFTTLNSTGGALNGTIGATTPATGAFTTTTATSYASNGSNGGVSGTEGTGASVPPGAGTDVLWPDSTAHRWKMNNNNGTSQNVLGSADFILQDCGTTTACANTVKDPALMVRGSVAFPTATTVVLTALPFTSSTSYSCTAGDVTTAAGVINATTYTSGASVTFTETGGANTDTIRYICIGF